MIARLLAVFALVCGGLGVTAAATQPAAAAATCTASSGVTVAVDFGHWGGPTVRGCAAAPTNGLQALHAVGFSTIGTVHDGPGFVCRIASGSFRSGTALPTADDQACVRTPPSSAYWSYWHANAGHNGWTYSGLGGSSYSPKPGSVDAWAFGAGHPPRSSPSSLRPASPASSPTHAATRPHSSSASPSTRSTAAQTTSERPTRTTTAHAADTARTTTTSTANRSVKTSPTTSTRTPESTAPPPRSTSAAPPSTGSTEATKPATGTASAASSPGASASAPAASSAAVVVDATPAAATSRGNRGSAGPALLGAALIVLLGAGAAVTMWRRRRTG